MADILTKEHLEAINKALEMIDTLKAEIEKAERAGIDQTENKKLLTTYTTQLQNIKRVYFPRGAAR